jgi:hypothetical protein
VGLLRAQYEHAIAMLLGKIPTDFSIPVKPMLYAPPPIPTGVPSQLVERRPGHCRRRAHTGRGQRDHRHRLRCVLPAGHHQRQWRIRELDVEPSVRLAEPLLVDRPLGFAGPSSTAAFIAPNCTSTRRIYNADLATYRQTLTAFQQVEDALAARGLFAADLRQQEAVKDAQDYLDLELAALQHRRRSVCRCGDRADHAAQQPGDTEFASGEEMIRRSSWCRRWAEDGTARSFPRRTKPAPRPP